MVCLINVWWLGNRYPVAFPHGHICKLLALAKLLKKEGNSYDKMSQEDRVENEII